MEIQTIRTSTILIATDGKTRLYKSRSEMAPQLRQDLQKTLNSSMAATILIADQRGREEILKLLRGEPSALGGTTSVIRRRLRTASTPAVRATVPAWMRSRWLRAAIAVVIPAAVGMGFYLLLTTVK